MLIKLQPYDNAILKTISINDQLIKRANKFKYLYSTLNNKWDNDRKIKIRATIANLC